jgi:hypothetical protein
MRVASDGNCCYYPLREFVLKIEGLGHHSGLFNPDAKSAQVLSSTTVETDGVDIEHFALAETLPKYRQEDNTPEVSLHYLHAEDTTLPEEPEHDQIYFSIDKAWWLYRELGKWLLKTDPKEEYNIAEK